jgi:2-methylcitrate dehydratase PrpD
MAQARDMRLAPDVAQDAKHRILDALAAMVSGSHLPAGEMAIHFARAQGGVAEATVLATDIRTSAVNAALANGMFAHADETDDFEPVTKAHPGSHVVPAALAMAEREGGSGAELLAAVTRLLPVSPGSRTGPGARQSPQRRGYEFNHGRCSGRGFVG